MAWIELHQGLREHKKMYACAEVLNLGKQEMIGTLVCLWLWALDNAQSGSLKGVSNRTIACVCGWPEKKAGKLVEALRDTGWLDYDPDNDCLVIHDWYDYAGKLMERRENDRKRKSKGKECGNISGGIPPESHGNSHATVPLPYHTVPNHDNSGNKLDSTCAQPAGQAPAILEGRSFTLFWENYPNKADRDDAWEAWKSLNPDADTVRAIKAGLDSWKKSGQWLDDGGRFVPSAAKWLTKRRWECPPPSGKQPIPKGASGVLGAAELEAIQRVLADGPDKEGGSNGTN